jgi:hypothetical protein
MNYNSNATAGGKASSATDFSFDSMLDEACERLLDRQLKYSIQRIHEMEKRLGSLEHELDEFIRVKKEELEQR